MKLSDVMGAMNLAHYAEIALLIFFVVFVLVVAHVMRRGMRDHWERARRLPLDDEPQAAFRSTRGERNG